MSKGIYCLIIFLDKNRKIKIGKRFCNFPRGFYCYVGSALNNLKKRIERHYRKNKKKHWHIDYFLDKSKIVDAKKIENFEKECSLSKEIEKFSDKIVMKGFGSSDCKCSTHLYYFYKNPSKILNKLIKTRFTQSDLSSL